MTKKIIYLNGSNNNQKHTNKQKKNLGHHQWSLIQYMNACVCFHNLDINK